MDDTRERCAERELINERAFDNLGCVFCRESECTTAYEGQFLCEEHFGQALYERADEAEKRAFLQENVDLWCEFAADSIREEPFGEVSDALLDALREMAGDYFEENFCSEWAKDEFLAYLKEVHRNE